MANKRLETECELDGKGRLYIPMEFRDALGIDMDKGKRVIVSYRGGAELSVRSAQPLTGHKEQIANHIGVCSNTIHKSIVVCDTIKVIAASEAGERGTGLEDAELTPELLELVAQMRDYQYSEDSPFYPFVDVDIPALAVKTISHNNESYGCLVVLADGDMKEDTGEHLGLLIEYLSKLMQNHVSG